MTKILLLIQNKENQRLLSETLKEEYEIVTLNDKELMDISFDLCLLDLNSFKQYQERLRAKKEEIKPRLLPYLLFVSSDKLRNLDPSVWGFVDDVVTIPVLKRELRGRVKALIRAHNLSIEKQELKESKEWIEILNTILRQDMNNRLGTSTGYLQMLQESTELTKDNREHLRKSLEINNNAMDLIRIVREAQKAREKSETTTSKLNRSLKNAVKDNREKARERNIEIELRPPESELEVITGYGLKLLFSSLIEASIKKGGNPNKILITVKEENKEIIIRIEDDGNKIPEEGKKKILEENYIGDTSGLQGATYFIAKMLIKSYGGEFKMKDSELGGARFDIHLQKPNNPNS